MNIYPQKIGFVILHSTDVGSFTHRSVFCFFYISSFVSFNETMFYFIFITSIKISYKNTQHVEWKCNRMKVSEFGRESIVFQSCLLYPDFDKTLCRRESQMNFIVWLFFFFIPKNVQWIREKYAHVDTKLSTTMQLKQ